MKSRKAVKGLVDALFKIVIFLFLAAFDWSMIYMVAPYNPNRPDSEFVVVPGKAVAKLLIPKRNPYLKYVKVKDRNKVWMPALIAYILLALVLVASLVLVLLPPMPCEAVGIPVGRHGATVTVTTYNEKIPFIFVWLFCIAECLCILIPCFVGLLRMKKETVRSKIAFALIILLLLFMAGWFVTKMI